jgi:hypothetical protein
MMRYFAQLRLDQNDVFPWVVVDQLEGANDFVGPCFNPRDAALIAWALNHRVSLAAAHSDLRALIDECVNGGPPE